MNKNNIRKNLKRISKNVFIFGIIATTVSPCIIPVTAVYGSNSNIPKPPITDKRDWSNKIKIKKELNKKHHFLTG